MIKDLIAKAQAEIETRPLVAIDFVLDAYTEAKHIKGASSLALLEDLFCRSILRVHDSSDSHTLTQVSPSAVLFSRDVSKQNRRFAAICFLRLLARNRNFLNNIALSAKVFELFDDVLSDDFYPEYGLQTKDQTYKKEQALIGIVPQVESEMSDVTNSLDSLDILNSFRAAFMKKLNRPIIRAVIVPFLNRELLGP